MKGDFAKGIRLLKFSAEKSSSIVLFLLFGLAGLGIEVVSSIGAISSFDFSPVDAGSIFLVCAALFPSQMLLSVDVSTMVQSSAYKKKLQTGIHTAMLLVCVMAVFTLILVLRIAGLLLQGLPMEELNILPVGIFSALIIIYSGFVYKFFLVSAIGLYVIMMSYGAVSGYWFGLGRRLPEMRLGNAGTSVSIIASYGIILASVGLEYLISKRLYRFPLSRYALRCARSENQGQ